LGNGAARRYGIAGPPCCFPGVIAALAVAGAMYAAWNLLVKRARQRQIFTWLSLVAGVICFLPLFVFGAAPVSPSAWPFVSASGIVEALYFFALTRAYGLGAFSLGVRPSPPSGDATDRASLS